MTDLLLGKVKEYFNGEMNHDEKLLFEMELKKNKHLKELYDLYETIEQGLDQQNSLEEKELRITLAKLSGEYNGLNYTPRDSPGSNTAVRDLNDRQSIQRRTSILSSKGFLAAAVLLGVIVTFSVWQYTRREETPVAMQPGISDKNSIDPGQVSSGDQLPVDIKNDTVKQVDDISSKLNYDDLFAKNFKPDQLPINYSELLDEALTLYKNGLYKNAIAALDPETIKRNIEELRPRGEVTVEMEKEEKTTLFYAHYYRGISFMTDKRFERSLTDLKAALDLAPNQATEIKTRWYIALAHLKLGKIKEAGKQLEMIVKRGDNQISKKASDLMQVLRINF